MVYYGVVELWYHIEAIVVEWDKTCLYGLVFGRRGCW